MARSSPEVSPAPSSPIPPSPPQRAVEIATGGSVTGSDGSRVAIRAESICCHGDTPGAVEIAAAVRRALEAAGVSVTAPIPA